MWALVGKAAAIAAIALAGATHVLAQATGLGVVDFPTSSRSGSAQAQFLRGVAALHSFWYPVALDAFRTARQIEPDFAMAYWGEAMAHNHPVWGDPQETAAARDVIARLPAAASITAREQGYIEAVRILYGEGEKEARDRAYATAMERLHQAYPADHEAAAFHALALLGVAYGGAGSDSGPPRRGEALRQRMRAGAIASEVLRQRPMHPGAAHYVLHAFDDPDHAILGLHAAERYARIAPAAPHALHMPSHIFLQLGMWPAVVASNQAAWAASQNARVPDFHSLHWLTYGLLQQGREAEARAALADALESLARIPADDMRSRVYATYLTASMAATCIVETRRWQAAGEVLPARPTPAGDPAGMQAIAHAPAVYAGAYAAAATGSADPQVVAAELDAIRRRVTASPIAFVAAMAPILDIQGLQVAAVAHASQGRLDEALATIQRATKLEAAMPVPPGPPPQIKPSHELEGELLLQAGRPADAATAFAAALFRHPGRLLSRQGAASAASRVAAH